MWSKEFIFYRLVVTVYMKTSIGFCCVIFATNKSSLCVPILLADLHADHVSSGLDLCLFIQWILAWVTFWFNLKRLPIASSWLCSLTSSHYNNHGIWIFDYGFGVSIVQKNVSYSFLLSVLDHFSKFQPVQVKLSLRKKLPFWLYLNCNDKNFNLDNFVKWCTLPETLSW